MSAAEKGGGAREPGALRRLVEGLDARDPALTGHSELVSVYAARIATRLGHSLESVERMLLAGTVHDLGKVVLPDSILFKPGPLTPDEWDAVRRHPEAGAAMLAEAGFEDVAVWVLHHHERIDGSGYPHGLAGDDIPLESRILAVADAYEAMTADRVYRARLGHDAACAELRRCAGSQFDPDVVDAFLGAAPDELRELSERGRFPRSSRPPRESRRSGAAER